MVRTNTLGGVFPVLFFLMLLSSCSRTADQGTQSTEKEKAEAHSPLDAVKRALTFHASFEDGPDADFALGDRRLYTAPSYQEQDQARPGIGNPEVQIVAGAGRFGHALKFHKKNTHAIFYRAGKNVAFADNNWSGTVSFWLNLSPDQDLEPGFCDPIQITDKAYNDSAVWTDFTKDDKPRHFRLGVFGDLEAWNPEKLEPDQNPVFSGRLVAVTKPPFNRGTWTHVVATYSGLGKGAGVAKLYLNGELQGTSEEIGEAFTWDMAQATFRIGVNYVGLFDEAALFNRALDDEEVLALHKLEGGVASLHP